MSNRVENADDEFLGESDVNKEDDLFDELDNAAEEELLHFSDEDNFLETNQDGDIEYVDEQGNPVELHEGDQIEVLQTDELELDESDAVRTDTNFLEQSDKIEDSVPSTSFTEDSFNDSSILVDSVTSSHSKVIEDEEEEDNEDDDEEDDRRNRFRIERRNIVTISASKRNTRDIPDSLDSIVLEEEAAKAAEFMNREKNKKRGNWRGNRRGNLMTMQHVGNRKPPSLSVMPQPHNRSRDSPQQLAVVQGATRLPAPQNYQPQQLTVDKQFQNQSPNVTESQPLTPRKILINPHFRGPRPPQPTVSQTSVSRPYENPKTILKISPSAFESNQVPPSQPYNTSYEADYESFHHDSPAPPHPLHYHNPPAAEPPYPEQHHPPNAYHEVNYGHHSGPQPPPQIHRPPPHQLPHPPPVSYHQPPSVSDSWSNEPLPQLHRSPPPPPHHNMQRAHHPQQNHHQYHQPHPVSYELRYRPPPPMSHYPQTPPYQRYQEQQFFSNGPPPPRLPQYPPPPHPGNHFRMPPPNIPQIPQEPLNYRPPPPRLEQFHEPQTPYDENYHQNYANYQPESPHQNSELQQPQLYQSFDNHKWTQNSYTSNQPPQNSVNQRKTTRMYHNQGTRGSMSQAFAQRQAFNKRAHEGPAFTVATSPKQARTEPRPVSKNIKQVPITENLPPPIVPKPLPPGKQVLPPEDEDEDTKELRKKLEEQKKIREENLRKKEERRRQMAAQRAKEMNEKLLGSTPQTENVTKVTEKPVIKPVPNLVPNLAFQVAPVGKKKVVVVRRAQNVNQFNHPTMGNVSVVPKVALVRGNVRGRGNPHMGQFRPRMVNQNTMGPNGGPRFPIPIHNTGMRGNIRGAMPIFRQPGCQLGVRKPDIRQATIVRPLNKAARIIQTPGNPRLKTVAKVIPVTNRQVISGDQTIPERRVQLPEGKTVVPANTRIVHAPHSQTQDRCVLINNLSATTTENQLRQLTQEIGAVEVIKLMKEGRALITFKQAQHAIQFQKKYQRHMLDLSMIQVSMVSRQS